MAWTGPSTSMLDDRVVAELTMVGRRKAELIPKKNSSATGQIPTAQDIILLLPSWSSED